MKKVYVCNRYPNLGVAFGDRMLQFVNGVLVCETEEEAAHIESLRIFGTFIVPRDLEEDTTGQETGEDGADGGGGGEPSPRLSLSRIGTMRKEELLKLAAELGVDTQPTTSRADLIMRISAVLKANGGATK